VTTMTLWNWIEGIHQAVMETTSVEDHEGLSLWWREVIANGISSGGPKS
jgi:hypothetical protein